MAKKDGGDNITFNVTNLDAGAVALGRNARANYTQTINSQTINEFQALSKRVDDALERLSVSPAVKSEARTHLAEATQAIQQQDVPRAKSALERMGDALKQAGVIVKQAVELAEPLTKLGNLVGLGLQFFV